MFKDEREDGTLRLTGPEDRLLPSMSTAGNTDYSTKTRSGWYVMDSAAASRPVNVTCFLDVRAYSTTYIEQVAREVTTGNEYIRYMVGGAWYNWVKIPTHARDQGSTLLELVNGYTGAGQQNRIARRGNVVDITLWADNPSGGIGGGAAIAYVPPEHRPIIQTARYFFGADSATGNALLLFYNSGYIHSTFSRPGGTSTIAATTWLAID